MPLSSHLGALADGLGCFPLDNGAYPPLSHSHTEGKGRVFLVCHDLVPLSQPASKQCFTPRPLFVGGCASTHFGENQLAPSSIGISPLTTAHPPIFQHRSVRASTWCYPSLTLAMVRSPGVGSIERDVRPIQTRFRWGSRPTVVNRASPDKSPAHSSTGTRSCTTRRVALPLLERSRFHVLFHSPPGVLFHLSLAVLVRYRSSRSM